jgi:hypothetical protein
MVPILREVIISMNSTEVDLSIAFQKEKQKKREMS